MLSGLLKNLQTQLSATSPDLVHCTKLMGQVRSAVPGSLSTFRQDEACKSQLVNSGLVTILKKYFDLAVPAMFGPGKTMEPPWDFLRTAGLLANATDASDKICQQIIESGLYKDVLKYLDKYFSPEATSNIECNSIIWFFCTLGNILVYVEARNEYRECNALAVACKYRKQANFIDLTYIVESFIVQIVDDSEVETVYQTDQIILYFLEKLKECVYSNSKSVDIGEVSCRAIDMLLPVNHMLVNKANQKRLVDHGVTDVYAKLLQVTSSR